MAAKIPRSGSQSTNLRSSSFPILGCSSAVPQLAQTCLPLNHRCMTCMTEMLMPSLGLYDCKLGTSAGAQQRCVLRCAAAHGAAPVLGRAGSAASAGRGRYCGADEGRAEAVPADGDLVPPVERICARALLLQAPGIPGCSCRRALQIQHQVQYLRTATHCRCTCYNQGLRLRAAEKHSAHRHCVLLLCAALGSQPCCTWI